MIKQCLVCGSDFQTYRSKILLGRGKYCSKECSMKITNQIFSKNGENSRFKKGQIPTNKVGFTLTRARKDGKCYRLIYKPEHPACSKRGYVREHRLVMEESINRYLSANEIVHHKNGDTLDNRIENLQLMTGEEHRREHLKDNVHKRWQ